MLRILRGCSSLSLGASEPGPHFIEHHVRATAANGQDTGIVDFLFFIFVNRDQGRVLAMCVCDKGRHRRVLTICICDE